VEHRNADGPLAGVRVVDLTRLLPGPFCSWYLSSLGAEVVRIEAVRGGDPVRAMPPVLRGEGVLHACINRGKSSVALEYRDPRGREALLALIATADVVLESFRPGVLAKAGVGPEALMERFPGLVGASITGYGQSGPLRDAPGHDINYVGYAGLVAALRPPGPGEGPDPLPVQLADVAGGALTAALGVAAALVSAGKTGRGRWLDISMTEGSLALMAPMLSIAVAEGRDLKPGGEFLTGGYGPYRSYHCQDGRLICVGALEPKFWMALCAAAAEGLGEPPPAPTAEAVGAMFALRPRAWWLERLVGCCVSPALGASALAEHPLHVERGNFEEVLGVKMPRAPFRWGPAPDAPALGAHTRAVLAPLGVDVDALIAAGLAREARS